MNMMEGLIAQWVECLPSKPDDLSSIPEKWEGETQSHKVILRGCTCNHADVHVQKYTHTYISPWKTIQFSGALVSKTKDMSHLYIRPFHSAYSICDPSGVTEKHWLLGSPCLAKPDARDRDLALCVVVKDFQLVLWLSFEPRVQFIQWELENTPSKTNILQGSEDNTREVTEVTVTLCNFLMLKRTWNIPNGDHKHEFYKNKSPSQHSNSTIPYLGNCWNSFLFAFSILKTICVRYHMSLVPALRR